MKAKSLSTKLIFVFLFIAVTLYFVVQGYYYLLNPQTTTLTYQYQTEESIAANGYFVRDEKIVSCSDTLLELERAEGERVAAGGVLATAYSSEEALWQHQELETLRAKLEQLRYAQTAAKDAETALKLDGDIREEIIALRAAVCAGNYYTAVQVGGELKTTVLKREYAYDGAEDLSERIEELRAQIKTYTAQLSGGAKTITAPFAGTYSAVVDGYEEVLSSAMLQELTPSGFDAIAAKPASSTVGKLIEGETWYFVTVLSASEAEELEEGQALLLRAPSGVDFDLSVTVDRVGKEESGRVIVVLRGDSHLAYVTLLREQSVELILRSYSGLRIPKNALRVDENGNAGVFCRVGLIAYLKPVSVIYQGEDYCLVAPQKIDSTIESRILLYTLRAGDEVIISANDLYDGKVVG